MKTDEKSLQELGHLVVCSLLIANAKAVAPEDDFSGRWRERPLTDEEELELMRFLLKTYKEWKVVRGTFENVTLATRELVRTTMHTVRNAWYEQAKRVVTTRFKDLELP